MGNSSSRCSVAYPDYAPLFRDSGTWLAPPALVRDIGDMVMRYVERPMATICQKDRVSVVDTGHAPCVKTAFKAAPCHNCSRVIWDNRAYWMDEPAHPSSKRSEIYTVATDTHLELRSQSIASLEASVLPWLPEFSPCCARLKKGWLFSTESGVHMVVRDVDNHCWATNTEVVAPFRIGDEGLDPHCAIGDDLLLMDDFGAQSRRISRRTWDMRVVADIERHPDCLLGTHLAALDDQTALMFLPCGASLQVIDFRACTEQAPIYVDSLVRVAYTESAHAMHDANCVAVIAKLGDHRTHGLNCCFMDTRNFAFVATATNELEERAHGDKRDCYKIGLTTRRACARPGVH